MKTDPLASWFLIVWRSLTFFKTLHIPGNQAGHFPFDWTTQRGGRDGDEYGSIPEDK